MDLFTLVYVYIGDSLKAAARSGLFRLPHEPHQKGTYAEIMTIALGVNCSGQLLSRSG